MYNFLLGTPDNFRAEPSERRVTFSWSAPSVLTTVIGYRLSCSPPPKHSSLPYLFTTPGTYNLTGFHPDTFYNCSLVAYSMNNTGPPAIATFSTREDCELISCCKSYGLIFLFADLFFQLMLEGLIICTEWVVSPDNVFF